MKGYDVLRLYRWSLSEPFRQLHYGFRGIPFEKQVPSKGEPVFYPRLPGELASITIEDFILVTAKVFAEITGGLSYYTANIVGAPFRLNKLLDKRRENR